MDFWVGGWIASAWWRILTESVVFFLRLGWCAMAPVWPARRGRTGSLGTRGGVSPVEFRNKNVKRKTWRPNHLQAFSGSVREGMYVRRQPFTSSRPCENFGYAILPSWEGFRNQTQPYLEPGNLFVEAVGFSELWMRKEVLLTLNL